MQTSAERVKNMQTLLKKERDRARLGVLKLSEKSNVQASRIRQLIHGEGETMTPREAFKLAEALDVSALYLLGIEEGKRKSKRRNEMYQ